MDVFHFWMNLDTVDQYLPEKNLFPSVLKGLKEENKGKNKG